jgi:hypothetical protein
MGQTIVIFLLCPIEVTNKWANSELIDLANGC